MFREGLRVLDSRREEGREKRDREVKCFKDIIMNGFKRGVSIERDPVNYGRGRESEMLKKERERSETVKMSYRASEGERAFTHGDRRVI